MEFVKFREAEEGFSEFVYSTNLNTWFCGDSNGFVHEFSPNNGDFIVERKESPLLRPVYSLAINRDEDIIALACANEVHLYNFPDVETSAALSIG